jgi:amino acid adenylation domain-containing protein
MTSTPSISPESNEAEATAREGFVFPASFAQRRLWFLQQFDPGSSLYNILVPIRVNTPLNVEVLRQSLQEIVRRHEALRTTFTSVDGEPMQVVSPAQTIDLNVVELRALPAAEREAEAHRLSMLEAQRPFSLAHGPLLRATLLTLASADHVLLLTMHHIVSDGWSMGVLYRELSSLYAAYSAGRPSPLPDLPVQYADFAHWQSELLQGTALEEQLSYWKRQLGGAPELLGLLTDRPRPAVQTYYGGVHGITLEPHLYDAVRALSRREGVTMFMTLLAAFQTLLHRYSGEDDIVVGSPIANRTRVELEGLIGLFINTLVLRTDLSGDPTFRQLLARVREVTLGAYAHQDMPFEKLVEELQPARDLSHNPLFQVMFLMQSADGPSAQQPAGTEPTGMEILTGTAKFDLTISVSEMNRTAVVAFEYNTDLFEKATIERLTEHFQRLLQSIVRDPDLRLSELSLLTDAEREQMLVVWNQTEAEYPPDVCVHELFERQVERTPEAVALVHENERVTYAELNARANRIAHALGERGVGPEVLVGLYLDRSVEMVASMLGVLKAGGAYLPLDPAYPEWRLAFTLEDARAAAIITQPHLLERLPDAQGAHVLCLDPRRECLADYGDENPQGSVSADALAYVLYTSGSTGMPKGVAIQHRNVVAFLHWARDLFEPDELVGVLASTSISFDLSVFELFAPLCWGGRVVLAKDALQLPTLAAADEVKLVNTVPSAMAELIRLRGVPQSVRIVNLAGEPLANSLAQQIYEQGGVEYVLNLYGPTEGTTYSTYALIEKGSDEEVRIGSPLSNNRVYLLDEHLRPVPVGMPGHLHIAGAGVARGYLNRPELTAEKFIPDPFSAEPGARLYRTGDLARYRANGQITYLGRNDHQVKVRGYRIELGEIESALREQPGVSEAVVMVREDAVGDKRLVAYLVNGGGAIPEAGELRRALRVKLPEYMLPSDFVPLAALPLLPNGKLDRRALPDPEGRRLGWGEAAYVAPRNSVEQYVANVYGEMLKIERVGALDNFFELGGHSLLATRIVSRIQEAHGVAVPLRRFFETPTVEGVALAIGDSLREAGGAVAPVITRLADDEPATGVDKLSDDEVASMLEALLAEGKDGG